MCIQSSVCKNPPRVRKLARRNGLQERSSSRHGGDVHRPDYAVPCGNCCGGAQPCTDLRKYAQLWSFDDGGIGLKCACFLCWICLVIEGRNGTRSTTMLVEGGGKHICVCEALEEFVSFWLLSIWRQRRTRTYRHGLMCALALMSNAFGWSRVGTRRVFLKSSEDVLFWNKVVRLLAGAWSPSSCLSASSSTRQGRL